MDEIEERLKEAVAWNSVSCAVEKLEIKAVWK
jgi:hypothetical protein